jgi:hypothetical protein
MGSGVGGGYVSGIRELCSRVPGSKIALPRNEWEPGLRHDDPAVGGRDGVVGSRLRTDRVGAILVRTP